MNRSLSNRSIIGHVYVYVLGYLYIQSYLKRKEKFVFEHKYRQVTSVFRILDNAALNLSGIYYFGHKPRDHDNCKGISRQPLNLQYRRVFPKTQSIHPAPKRGLW